MTMFEISLYGSFSYLFGMFMGFLFKKSIDSEEKEYIQRNYSAAIAKLNELDPKAREITTLNHIDDHLQHIKLHMKVLNEQKPPRKTRRISKGSNTAFKKRVKTSASNHKRPRKRVGL